MEKIVTSFLFVFFDPGETFALLPVMEKMEKEGIKCHVLSIAHAKDHLLSVENCTSLEELVQIDSSIPWTRDRGLNQEQLTSLLNGIDADNIVCGMVSKVQYQIASAYKKEYSKIFCYYDSFTELNPNMIQYPFLKIADITMASCDWTAGNLQSFSPLGPVFTVGQPTLEVWREKVAQVEKERVKNQIGISEHKVDAMFIGGYGTPYEIVLEMLLKAFEKVGGYQFWISLHPKSNGEIEQKLIDNYPKCGVKILPKTLSTTEAAPVMDLIICHFSTVGIQALSIGKPVVFVQAKDCIYPNLATDLGLAKLLSEEGEIINFLTLFLKNSPSPLKIQQDFKAKSGMPEKSLERIYQNLVTAAKVTPTKNAR